MVEREAQSETCRLTAVSCRQRLFVSIVARSIAPACPREEERRVGHEALGGPRSENSVEIPYVIEDATAPLGARFTNSVLRASTGTYLLSN